MIQYIFVAEIVGSQKDRNDDLLARVQEFPKKIPGIVDFAAGFNEIGQQRINWGVSIRFKDKAAWEAYKTNPIRLAVVEEYGHLVKDSSTIEYEVF